MAVKMLIFCPECDTQVPDGFRSCPQCHIKVDGALIKHALKKKRLKKSGYHVGGFSPLPILIGAVFAAGLIVAMHFLLASGDLAFLIIHYYLAAMFIISASAYAARRAYGANFIHGILTAMACGVLLTGAYLLHCHLTGTTIQYPPQGIPLDALSIYAAGTLAAGAIGGCLGLVGK